MGQQKDYSGADEPLFNIGAVARMTDIPETTLRAWERRYDFPASARTAGGHRLYSHHEVMRLQWVKRRIDEGLQISQAIRTLQHAEREGEPFPMPGAPLALAAREAADDALTLWRRRLLDALLAHNADRANQILGEALALFPLEYLILEVIGPALNDIGEAWSEGRAGVATEHFATSHLRHHLLMWLRIGPPTYPVSPLVLACAPGELHEGSLLMLAVLLRRLRWPVIYLGQTMPLEELAGFVAEVDAEVIVFVAMTEPAARALADWPRWLPAASDARRPTVAYGGRAFVEQPDLVDVVPGTFLGNTLHEAVPALDRMLRERNPLVR